MRVNFFSDIFSNLLSNTCFFLMPEVWLTRKRETYLNNLKVLVFFLMPEVWLTRKRETYLNNLKIITNNIIISKKLSY